MRSSSKFILFFLVFSVLGLTLILYFIPNARNYVQEFFLRYGYFGVFFIALVGGISTLFPIPYTLTVFGLSQIGLNPFLLGIIAGIGASIGDSFSYYLGYRGHEILSEKNQKRFLKLQKIISNYPRIAPILIYFYGAIVPFSDDIILIPLGTMRYKYWKAILPICFGKITLNTYIALGGMFVGEGISG